MAEAEILSAYPDLEVEDVREALLYAAEAVRERDFRSLVVREVKRHESRPSTADPPLR
jgi:hypothetical protein